MPLNPQSLGLLLCDDLIFTSRITGVARDLGLPMQVVRTAAELLTQAAALQPACILLDLHNNGIAIEEIVRQLTPQRRPFIVGYGSHVDTAILKQARAAGCDLVLPRSKFVEDLPTALPRWYAGQAD
jgi:CheY-like chemotaxis protein